MTISTTTSRVDYTGNGVTTAFAVPFVFFGTDELRVVERVIATGVETTLALSTHYTVSGGNGAVGTVTAVSAPAATVQWTILRNTARTQATAYPSNDPFPASSHERALDRVTAIAQEIERDQARAVRVAETDTSTVTLPSSVARASKALWFDGSGNPIAAVDPSGYPATAWAATLLDDPDLAAAQVTMGMPWVLIETRDVAAVANAVFALSSAFRRFRLTCQDVRANATGRNLALQFSTDGGATWVAGTNNVYHGLYSAAGTTFPFNQGSAACIYLSIMLSFSGNGQTDATAEIFPGNASRAATMKAVVEGNNNTDWYSGTFGGACNTGGVANALRVLTTTGTSSAVAAGNFSGTLILEGLR